MLIFKSPKSTEKDYSEMIERQKISLLGLDKAEVLLLRSSSLQRLSSFGNGVLTVHSRPDDKRRSAAVTQKRSDRL